MLKAAQSFSELKMSWLHFLNFPIDGKRGDTPSQTKHWEILPGVYYYPHLTGEETESQKVKANCPRSTASKI